jgi:hypothetical protein
MTLEMKADLETLALGLSVIKQPLGQKGIG